METSRPTLQSLSEVVPVDDEHGERLTAAKESLRHMNRVAEEQERSEMFILCRICREERWPALHDGVDGPFNRDFRLTLTALSAEDNSYCPLCCLLYASVATAALSDKWPQTEISTSNRCLCTVSLINTGSLCISFGTEDELDELIVTFETFTTNSV